MDICSEHCFIKRRVSFERCISPRLAMLHCTARDCVAHNRFISLSWFSVSGWTRCDQISRGMFQNWDQHAVWFYLWYLINTSVKLSSSHTEFKNSLLRLFDSCVIDPFPSFSFVATLNAFKFLSSFHTLQCISLQKLRF